MVQVEQSAWTSVGINMTALDGSTFDTVVGDYAPPCASATPCTEESAGGAAAGSTARTTTHPVRRCSRPVPVSNAGNYSNAEGRQPDQGRPTTPTTNLDAYQNYIAKQLPMIWEPNADYELTKWRTNLQGVAPQNPFANLFPENWYYVK